jgi:octaprenyl-diphosphate synthase
LFGSEVKAGKSLGTDLAKGKLTFPVLLAWERASAADRARLEQLVQHWQPASLPRVSELLARYGTLEPTIDVIERYLDHARESLRALPESSGRAGLFGVTEYLARQTATLSE